MRGWRPRQPQARDACRELHMKICAVCIKIDSSAAPEVTISFVVREDQRAS
jgi:hypothetical protein